MRLLPAYGVEHHGVARHLAARTLVVVAVRPATCRSAEHTERAERQLGEQPVNALDFLEAENVRLVRAGETLDEIETQADRVDVPGGEAKSH